MYKVFIRVWWNVRSVGLATETHTSDKFDIPARGAASSCHCAMKLSSRKTCFGYTAITAYKVAVLRGPHLLIFVRIYTLA